MIPDVWSRILLTAQKKLNANQYEQNQSVFPYVIGKFKTTTGSGHIWMGGFKWCHQNLLSLVSTFLCVGFFFQLGLYVMAEKVLSGPGLRHFNSQCSFL